MARCRRPQRRSCKRLPHMGMMPQNSSRTWMGKRLDSGKREACFYRRMWRQRRLTRLRFQRTA